MEGGGGPGPAGGLCGAGGVGRGRAPGAPLPAGPALPGAAPRRRAGPRPGPLLAAQGCRAAALAGQAGGAARAGCAPRMRSSCSSGPRRPAAWASRIGRTASGSCSSGEELPNCTRGPFPSCSWKSGWAVFRRRKPCSSGPRPPWPRDAPAEALAGLESSLPGLPPASRAALVPEVAAAFLQAGQYARGVRLLDPFVEDAAGAEWAGRLARRGGRPGGRGGRLPAGDPGQRGPRPARPRLLAAAGPGPRAFGRRTSSRSWRARPGRTPRISTTSSSRRPPPWWPAGSGACWPACERHWAAWRRRDLRSRSRALWAARRARSAAAAGLAGGPPARAGRAAR